MEKGCGHILLAAPAVRFGGGGWLRAGVVLLLVSLAVAGLQERPALGQEASSVQRSFSQQCDDALNRWNSGVLERLSQAAKSPQEAALARAYAFFLLRDFEAAAEAAKGTISGQDPQVSKRGEWIMNLAEAWRDVIGSACIFRPAPKYLVHFPKSQSIWGARAAERIPSIVGPALEYFQVKNDRPVEVSFLERIDQLSAVSGIPPRRLSLAGVRAVTTFGHIFILSPSCFPEGYAWDVVLGHEAVHLAIRLKGAFELPVMLEEGIAFLLERLEQFAGPGDLGPQDRAILQIALDNGLFTEVPFSQTFLWEAEDELRARVWGLQGMFLARVIAARGGDAALVSLVEAVARGEGWEDAVRALTGYSGRVLWARARRRWRSEGSREHIATVLYSVATELLPERDRAVLEQAAQAVQLGDLLWGRGHRTAALRVYTRVPAPLQQGPELTWRIVRLLSFAGNHDEAVRRALTSLTLFPDDVRVIYSAAEALRSSGRTAQAAGLAQRAALLNPFAQEPWALVNTINGDGK